jgi:hypothetical protein
MGESSTAIPGDELVCPDCGRPTSGVATSCDGCGKNLGYVRLPTRAVWENSELAAVQGATTTNLDVDLPPAKILHVEGWGKKTPTRGLYTVALMREGDGVVQINHELQNLYPFRSPELYGDKDRMAYRFEPEALVLTVKNGAVRSGGGFIAGGFGVEGAALGMAAGALLNSLTTRNRHYGMLVFSGVWQQDATPRVVVLGYRGLADMEIAQRVSAAMPSFMDYWIDRRVERLDEADSSYRAATRPAIDLMAQRGILTNEQLDRVGQELRARGVEVEGTGVEELGPEPANDMVAQLQRLGELHANGVLNDEEFATAKARLLAT